MNRDMSACRNIHCQAYKDNECKRSNYHKYCIDKRLSHVAYISNRMNETKCELFIPCEVKEEK